MSKYYVCYMNNDGQKVIINIFNKFYDAQNYRLKMQKYYNVSLFQEDDTGY